MDMRHGHGLSAWTLACSMDKDTQHVLGHAAWKWTWICSLDGGMDKQHLLAHVDVHV
jgi:hypothetical protein